jgi:hypothetical protein
VSEASEWPTSETYERNWADSTSPPYSCMSAGLDSVPRAMASSEDINSSCERPVAGLYLHPAARMKTATKTSLAKRIAVPSGA